ncbi:RalA-binding protein 1-A [Trichinella zimbabwensis]|uniref:RalA-binding protein 1-A n=1 Tax=Trichinella zimbabwensis TaxID=268475 RepID=A0A0V1GVX5_9BILA|nr:RalA-binding protein 1-A [Trichinella zimbabwensis]
MHCSKVLQCFNSAIIHFKKNFKKICPGVMLPSNTGLRYVFREALRLDRTSPECQTFTIFVLSYLNMLEDGNKVDERLNNENVAQKYMKRVALNVFQEADKIDCSGKFSITVVRLFIRASNLINVLTIFGDLDDSLIEARKYGRWRGAYLFDCFNSSKNPLPALEEVNESLDQVRYHGELSYGPCDNYNVYGVAEKIVVPLHYSEMPDDGALADVKLEEALEQFADFNNAHDLCKMAVVALQHEKVADSIFNFEQAYKIMEKYKKNHTLYWKIDLWKMQQMIVKLYRSSESLYQCDEWTSKKGKREKKDKGYCYLHRLSSEEQLVHIRPKPKKTVFGKLKEKSREKEKEKEKEQKSKSKSKLKCKNKAETVTPAAPARPVFAVPLARALCNNPSYDRVPVPAFVRRCIDYINENGLDQEGLYRVSAVKNSLEELRNAVDNGEEPSFGDAHQAACLLKLFIRELPESLFTEELLDKFEHAAHIAECLGRLCELIERLPAPNKFFLAYFFLHLHEITQRQERNKMTIAKMCFILQPLFNVSQQLLNAFLQNPQILFPNVSLKKYISPLRPASGKSLPNLPTDPKAILEELAKQEFLLSHLHDEINSGINDPQKEEQLWDVQRLVTQLKRELKSLKKKNINAFDEVEQESGPCIEMFEEKQLLAVHMDLRNKIEIQRALIEELIRQMDDIGGQHAVLSARSVARFSDAELSSEKKYDAKWPEQYSALEDRKRELIESIVSERQKCVRLLAEMEMLAYALDALPCKHYTTYNYIKTYILRIRTKVSTFSTLGILNFILYNFAAHNFNHFAIFSSQFRKFFLQQQTNNKFTYNISMKSDKKQTNKRTPGIFDTAIDVSAEMQKTADIILL